MEKEEKKKKKKRGRQWEGWWPPLKMTESVLKNLLDCFSVWSSDQEACMYAWISEPTLYAYQKKHPKFLERKMYLKNHSIKLQAKLNIRRAIQEEEAKAFWWTNNSWKWLEKKDPEFKNIVGVENIDPPKLSPESEKLLDELALE